MELTKAVPAMKIATENKDITDSMEMTKAEARWPNCEEENNATMEMTRAIGSIKSEAAVGAALLNPATDCDGDDDTTSMEFTKAISSLPIDNKAKRDDVAEHENSSEDEKEEEEESFCKESETTQMLTKSVSRAYRSRMAEKSAWTPFLHTTLLINININNSSIWMLSAISLLVKPLNLKTIPCSGLWRRFLT